MYIIDIVRRSSRSLLSAKARTVLTAFAIAVGTFALTLTLAASNGAQHYANNIVNTNFDPTELIVSKDGGALNATSDANKPQVYDPSFGTVTSAAGAVTQVKMLDDNDLQRLAQYKGVASVYPAIALNLQYLTRDGQKKYVATMEAYNAYQKPDVLAGSIPDNLANNTLILPEGFVSALGFSSAQQAIGQTVRLSIAKQVDQAAILTALSQGNATALTTAANPSSAEQQFTIAAVTKAPSALIQPGTQLYLYANQADILRLKDLSTAGSTSYHKYLSAYVKVSDGTDVTKLKAVQAAIKKDGYGAQSIQDTEKFLTQIITVLQGIVTVFGLIAVVASVFGVVNTMYISVLQRTREIGLMKALGMHKKDVTRLFRFEAAFIGLLGGILGSVIAILLGTVLNPFITRKLGLGSQHLLEFKPLQVVLLIAALMFVATLAGLLPARKAARLDPIEALRTE